MTTTALLWAALLVAATPTDASPTLHRRAHTLKELGFESARQTSLSRAEVALRFATRQDRVAVAGRLELQIAPAAARQVDASALHVRLNDQALTRIDLQGEEQTAAADVVIPPELVGQLNTLTLALDGARRLECPAFVRPGAWQVVAGGSLHINSAPLPWPNDLGAFPLPFYDQHTDHPASVDVAFLTERSAETLQAASLIAARFGLEANTSVRFSVHFDTLPATNAVVLLTADHPAARRLGLPRDSGPSLQLVDHPRDPGGNRKLLLASGRHSADLLTVARHLAAGTELPMAASRVRFSDPPAAVPSLPPYAGPLWGRAAESLSPFARSDSADLVHTGPAAGTVATEFRMSPDVFLWPAQFIPLDFVYGLRLPAEARARITVELNGQFVGRISRRAVTAGSPRRARFRVRTDNLRGHNTLRVHVAFADSDRRCPPATSPPPELTVSNETALRLQAASHFAKLPDLAKFIYDGFPFTRRADLSETVLVLPQAPTTADARSLLSVMSHFAAVTGVAGTRASFLKATAASSSALAGKDVLVIGQAHRQSLIRAWSEHLPLRAEQAGLTVHRPGRLQQIRALLQGRRVDAALHRAAFMLARPSKLGAVVGIESPLSPGRSVVVLTGEAQAAPPTIREMQRVRARGLAAADLMLVGDDESAVFRVGPRYGVGNLDAWTSVRWHLAEHWLVLFPVAGLGSVLIAGAALPRLRQRRARRLRGEE